MVQKRIIWCKYHNNACLNVRLKFKYSIVSSFLVKDIARIQSVNYSKRPERRKKKSPYRNYTKVQKTSQTNIPLTTAIDDEHNSHCDFDAFAKRKCSGS